MEDVRCPICEADFRPNAMVSSGGVMKCKICAEQHPKASTKEEAQGKTKDVAETMTEPRIRAIIYEVLEEANIKRVECGECKELFFRRSPAQKTCQKCRTNKEVK